MSASARFPGCPVSDRLELLSVRVGVIGHPIEWELGPTDAGEVEFPWVHRCQSRAVDGEDVTRNRFIVRSVVIGTLDDDDVEAFRLEADVGSAFSIAWLTPILRDADAHAVVHPASQ